MLIIGILLLVLGYLFHVQPVAVIGLIFIVLALILMLVGVNGPFHDGRWW